jgi:hypothetical protein
MTARNLLAFVLACATPVAWADDAATQAMRQLVSRIDPVFRILEEIDTESIRFSATDTSPETQASLEKYYREYKAELAALSRTGVASESEMEARLRDARVVLFTDLHGMVSIKKKATGLLETMIRLNPGPKVVVAEFIPTKYQPELNTYLGGGMTTDQFKAAIRYTEGNIFWEDWWPAFAALLEDCRRLEVDVLAAYPGDENSHWAEIARRDSAVLELVQAALAERPDAQVFLLHGAAHVLGANHFADALAARYPDRTVTFVTDTMGQFWQMAADGVPFDSTLQTLTGPRTGMYYFHTGAPDSGDSYAFPKLARYAVKARRKELAEKAAAARGTYRRMIELIEKGDADAAGAAFAELRAQAAAFSAELLAPGLFENEGIAAVMRPFIERLLAETGP